MNAISFEGPSTNPEILAIADRVAGVVQLAIQRAANDVQNPPATRPMKGLENSVFDFLNKRKKSNPAGVRALAGLSRNSRRLSIMGAGPLSSTPIMLNFSAPKTIVEQAQAAGYFDNLKISPETIGKWDKKAKNFAGTQDTKTYIYKIIQMMAFSHVLDSNSSITAPSQTKKAKELHLKLADLKAVRRFGLEATDWGNDHISAGGDGLDSVQQHVKAPQFFIHTFTRDGETRNFADRTFVKFDLNHSGQWPRAFMGNVFLAEKDADGGFIEFLQLLWDAIAADVVKLATSLALSALGSIVGAVVLSELPVVGTIVGAIAGAAIGYIVGWIIDTLKDDIFESPDNPLGVILESQDALFPGNRDRSPNYQQDFSLGESRYIMTYYWQLVY